MARPCGKLALAATLLWLGGAPACHDVHIDFSETGDSIRLPDDLYSVSVADAQHAVAVGYYGAAYWTADGGETWKKGATATRRSLYKVSMADSRHGWAVGQRGLILRTEDGGATWTSQPNLKEQEGAHLFSVSAMNQDSAWVVGEWGTRIRTDDGGETWVDYSFTIDETHPQFVWLAPHEQKTVREDSGVVYEDVGLYDVYCLPDPSTMCWLIGEFGYIFYSSDRGENWQQSSVEGQVELPPVVLAYNEIEVDDAQVEMLRGFAAQVKEQPHLNVAIAPTVSDREIALQGSDDPTQLFELLEARAIEVRTLLEEAAVPFDRLRMRGQPPWDFADYLEDDPRFLERYMQGRLAEAGGAKVWVIQNPILFSVRFQDEQVGMISGLGGLMLRTRDGGRTWAYRDIDRQQALFSVDSVDGRAVAVGEKGLVRISPDGGDTWQPPGPGARFPELFTYMRDVQFAPDGQVGFIVGQTGTILRSTDSGVNWESVFPKQSSG